MTVEQKIPADKTEKYNQVLDLVVKTLRLKNDAALARAMGVAPPVISKLRHGRITMGPSFLIDAHELTGIGIKTIKSMLGEKFLGGDDLSSAGQA